MKDQEQQNTKQFMEYYDLYSNDIFRFCMIKTKDREKSLDITQDTFTKLWEYILKGTHIEQARALLYRIARNLIIDNYRKKKEVLVEDYSSDISFKEQLRDDQHIEIERLFDARKTLELLHRLPDTLQEIISLHFVEGFSIQEIAKLTNTAPKTVSVYIHRGVQTLKKILHNYEQ